MILITLGIIAGVGYLEEKKNPKRYYKGGKRPFKILFSCLYKIHPGREELLLTYETRCSRTERSEGTCSAVAFSF